jgi:hypothetical protein
MDTIMSVVPTLRTTISFSQMLGSNKRGKGAKRSGTMGTINRAE